MRRALSLLVLVLACRPTGDTFGPASPRHDPDTVVVSNGAEPKSIDPGLADESSGIEIVNNVFEGLTAYAPRTLAPEPGMAERWTTSEDGLTWTFHLRDAQWSDGTPVTAHDFVYAWRRALSPALASQYAYQLWYIAGAQAFNEGKTDDPETVGVRAIDARTLEVRLERPTPFLLFLTSFATYSPVPRHAIERHGARWTQPGNIVSNGPYRLVRWALQDELVLEKNERYWNAAAVPVRRIVALTVESDHAVLNLYRTGEVDTTSPNASVPLSAVSELRKYGDWSERPYLGSYWYWFNCRKPPFDDAGVRKAFALSLDKERLIKTVLHGLNSAASSVVPDLFGPVTGYRPPIRPEDAYDVARARKLLAEAGFPNGRDFPAVTLVYNTGDGHRLIAEAAQSMWKEALGVDVQVLNMEWKVMLSEMHQGNFFMGRSGWIADYPEPSTFLTVFLGGGGQNDSGWTNARYDALLQQALSERDPAKRNALYADAERILLDELPVLPVYTYSKYGLTSRKLGGLEDNPMDFHLFKHLRWLK